MPLAIDLLWVFFRHLVLRPLIKIVLVFIHLPLYVLNKILLALSYACLYISHAPYIIANMQAPDADDDDVQNFMWLVGILLGIIYLIKML